MATATTATRRRARRRKAGADATGPGASSGSAGSRRPGGGRDAAVTAYPLGRAVWLSLYSYRLTDPAGREFVGLRNYGVVLSDRLWWNDVFTTVLITVVTVAVELVIGFAFAW